MAAGNSTILLADVRLAQPPDLVSGWVTPPPQREVQVVQLARARNAKTIERGNLLVSHTFTVSRQHDTLVLAEEYLADLPRVIGRAFGAFNAQRELGARTIELENAWATYQPQPVNGLRTTITFTVTGTPPAELT